MRLSVLAVALMAIASPVCAQKPITPSHPLLGTWKLTVPGGVCSEVYTFREDGIRRFSSAEEQGESAFILGDTPTNRGFYTFTDTIKKTNGKRDCSGATTPIGHKVTLFIRFHPQNRDEFLLCRDESLAQCIGPLTRVKPNAS